MPKVKLYGASSAVITTAAKTTQFQIISPVDKVFLSISCSGRDSKLLISSVEVVQVFRINVSFL